MEVWICGAEATLDRSRDESLVEFRFPESRIGFMNFFNSTDVADIDCGGIDSDNRAFGSGISSASRTG